MTQVTITVDLKEAGLRHAPGRADGCGGEHEIVIEADEFDLHPGDDCPASESYQPRPGTAETPWERAVQRLHEQAHPHGPVFAGSCTEAECRELTGAPGSML